VKKYCWLICVREKYCSGWKFTIVYDKQQPNEQADGLYASHARPGIREKAGENPAERHVIFLRVGHPRVTE